MRAIDADVLLRLLVRDDRRQLAPAEAYLSSGGWVSQLAIARKAGHVPRGTLDKALGALPDAQRP